MRHLLKSTEKMKIIFFSMLGLFIGLIGPLGGWFDLTSCYIRGMGPWGGLCDRFWNYFHFLKTSKIYDLFFIFIFLCPSPGYCVYGRVSLYTSI